MIGRRKVWAVIPARWGSTRFPGKPLALIHGTPMIVKTFQQVCKCTRLHQVIVATDDERIEKVVHQAGGRVVMTSSSCVSGTDRVFEAMSKLGDVGEHDLVVNVQGDEPFIEPPLVDRLVQHMESGEEEQEQGRMALMGTVAELERDMKLAEDRNIVKVVVNQHSNALYFSRSCIPHGAQTSFWRHIGLYAYQYDFLQTFSTKLKPGLLEQTESLEQLRALEAGYSIKVLCNLNSTHQPGIDTPAQLEQLALTIQ